MTDTSWTTKTAAAQDTRPVSSAVHTGYDAAEKTEDGIPLYGMDKELAAKAAAKRDPKKEQEARGWIEALTGMSLDGTLQEALKSGIVLCALASAIKPGVCKKASTMAMPFKQMENISNFLDACTKLGVGKHDLFQVGALALGQPQGRLHRRTTPLSHRRPAPPPRADGQPLREQGHELCAPHARGARPRRLQDARLQAGVADVWRQAGRQVGAAL